MIEIMKEGILNMKRGTWAEINLNNIKHNFHALKNTLKADTKVCCVVKADAYGHGAVEVAKMLNKPVPTVNRKYHVVLNKIKKMYKEKSGERN